MTTTLHIFLYIATIDQCHLYSGPLFCIKPPGIGVKGNQERGKGKGERGKSKEEMAPVKSAALVFFEEFNGAPITGSTLRFDKQRTGAGQLKSDD